MKYWNLLQVTETNRVVSSNYKFVGLALPIRSMKWAPIFLLNQNECQIAVPSQIEESRIS